jgi:hypothetical protein
LQNKVAELLKVPQYADLLDDDNDADANKDGEELSVSQSGLVKSHKGWRKKMAKWVQEEQARSELSNSVDDSDEEEQLQNVTYGQQQSKWLPRSLKLLFTGHKESEIDEQLRHTRWQQAYMEEARLMELLADEEADEDRIPDDGELDRSGDNFDRWLRNSHSTQNVNNPLDTVRISVFGTRC